MMSETAIQAALDGLDALLEDLTLPPRTTQTIERLGERLASPVRIALMGPKGAGKSTLINVLAGETVLPPGVTLPTTQLQYAPEQMLAVTVADGTRRGFEALDFEAALALDPLFVEVALPAERLRHIGLLEVVTDGTEADVQAAGRWAAKRSEMMLWVTRGFDHLQQQLWRKVPQSLRDHAFLVLNGIDDYSTSDLSARIEAHDSFARGEFLGLTPVSAALAYDALGKHEEDERMLASGCLMLLEGIFHHISKGRQADIDAAAMYLQRFGRDLILPEEPDRSSTVQPTRLLYSHKTTGPTVELDAGALRASKAELAERAAAIKDAATGAVLDEKAEAMSEPVLEPEIAEDPVTEPDDVSSPQVEPDFIEAREPSDALESAVHEAPALPEAPEEPPQEVPAIAAEGDTGSADPEARAAPNFYLKRFGLVDEDDESDGIPRFDEAVARIEACANDLIRQFDDAAGLEPDTVLQCCLETVEAIADAVAADETVQETVFQASDFLLLLQMEKSPDVAEDAIVALMQIKRDCELAAA